MKLKDRNRKQKEQKRRKLQEKNAHCMSTKAAKL